MTSAGSPGRTSTTAKITTVARTSVISAAMRRRERKSIMAGGAPLPIDACQIRLRRRAVLPQSHQVLLPHADLGELEEEAVDGVLGDDPLRILQKLVALGEVGGGHDLAPLGLEGGRIVVPVVAVARVAIEVVGRGVGDDGKVVCAL